MIINVIADNLEMTSQHDELIYKKLSQKLEKYLKPFNADLTIANVHIKKRSRWGYQINFSMTLPGKKQLFAQETAKNFKLAVNRLNDQVIRQIKEYRSKLGIDEKTRLDIKGVMATQTSN